MKITQETGWQAEPSLGRGGGGGASNKEKERLGMDFFLIIKLIFSILYL